MHRFLLEDRVEKEPLQKLRLPSARMASLDLKAWLPWPIRVRKVPQGCEIVTADSYLQTRNLIGQLRVTAVSNLNRSI